jgi:hypothetical protein
MNINISNGMNKLKITFFVLMVILVLVVPSVSLAQESDWKGLVPCDNVTKPCDYNQLMNLVNKVINFIFVTLAVPICALMFAYAGFLMVTAGGESASAKTKAKEIFSNTVVGFLFIATSWLVIHIILMELGFDGSWIGF